MDLTRRGTQLGPPSKGATPGFHEDGSIEAGFLPVASGSHPNRLKKNLWTTEDQEGTPKIRRNPGAIDHQISAGHNVRIRHSSPWEFMSKRLCLSLDESVTVATQNHGGLFVAVKKFSGPDADQKVSMLRKIQSKDSPNILAFLHCFSFESSLFVVFEHEIKRGEKLPITLNHYAHIQRYPTEAQLAIIIGQILDGLNYLASIGLEHGALTCKNILISTEGSIRIGQENCRRLDSEQGSARDIRGVGYVTMALMHKDPIYEGPINVRDDSRWPLESNAVDFLLQTDSALSIESLKKHSLFNHERLESDMNAIRGDVYAAEFSVYRKYEVPREQDIYVTR